MAESEGFEPPIPFQVRRFSRPMPSTTRPALRSIQNTIIEKPPYRPLRFFSLNSRSVGPFAEPCRVPSGRVAFSALANFLSILFRIGPGTIRRIHRPQRIVHNLLGRLVIHKSIRRRIAVCGLFVHFWFLQQVGCESPRRRQSRNKPFNPAKPLSFSVPQSPSAGRIFVRNLNK